MISEGRKHVPREREGAFGLQGSAILCLKELNVGDNSNHLQGKLRE